MSFKDGIPLLTTLDDEDASDDDFTVELASTARHKWGRKHLIFGLGLGLVVFVVVVLIVAVTVPVVLLRAGGSGSKTGGGSIGASKTNSVSPTPTPSPTPTDLNSYKPTSDDRDYDFLLLSNSLRVVLISDPKSNISAASMEVAAGSFSDPPDTEGLAHFCEHMLFLGTEKYPNDHEYSNYLTAHGGGDNAFTSTQETNYFFTVDSKYLEKALDLFAQFFISPLFKNDSVADEVHAVNAEHEKNLQSDPWKMWQLLKHVSNPEHPFHLFSTGTLSTLNSPNLLELLKTYYTSSYSANTMQLVVYGKDPLTTLGEWVSTSFSSVPNRHISPQTFSTTAFPPEYTGKLVFYYPVADTNTLSLYWQTSPFDSQYRNDIVEFLSRYLGYEGEGSALQYLKGESLAVSLSVGSEVNADSFSLFMVNIELTEKGLGRVPDVVKTVFQFISLLSGQSEPRMKLLWDNHLAVSQVVYDRSEPEQPNIYTTSISQRMRIVAEEPDFLGNPRRYLFNYTLVMSVLDSLAPENLVLFLGTQHLNLSSSSGQQDDNLLPPQQGSSVDLPWPELDDLEPIYSTPYSRIDTPRELLEYWSNLTPFPQELSVVGKNYFIPTDFDPLPPPSNPSDTPYKVDLPSANGVSLWLLQDTTFQTPHMNMYCSIHSPNPDVNSVRWTELTGLYALVAIEVLIPVLYPAAELTYSMGLYASPKGLQLSFSGFSDPVVMTTYIGTTVQKMKDYNEMRRVFDIVREKRQDFLQNYKYQNLPYSYTYNYLQQVIMERPFWKLEEELAVVNDVTITADDVIQHAENLFASASYLCFAHGDINEDMATEYTRIIVGALSPSSSSSSSTKPAPSGSFQRQRVTMTHPGSYGVSLPTLNPNDQNSAVNVIFQVGPACTVPGSTAGSPCQEEYITATAHLGLINHIIGDQCFYQLRTVEQLGYVVFCFQPTYSGITSFQALVQSQEYNTSYVLGKINTFLENFEISTIANFTDDTLSANKELYARTLRKKSQTLRDESDRLWGEISTGREQFDYNDQLLGALSSITPQSLLGFYRQHMTDPTQFRKLVIGVHGVDKPVDLSQETSYCIDWETIDQNVLEYNATNSNCSTTKLTL